MKNQLELLERRMAMLRAFSAKYDTTGLLVVVHPIDPARNPDSRLPDLTFFAHQIGKVFTLLGPVGWKRVTGSLIEKTVGGLLVHIYDQDVEDDAEHRRRASVMLGSVDIYDLPGSPPRPRRRELPGDFEVAS